MSRFVRHSWLALALGGVLLALTSCKSNSSLPDEYLGRWYYLGSSGGIAGTGMGDEPTGYIELRADNTMAHFHEDGTPVATATFTLRRGETIFSSDEQWILVANGGLEEVILVSEDGQNMSLSQNVYDGFGRSYVRSR